MALITGVVLIIARLIRLGFLADFLSRSVLIGFLTGVGIQVAMGQVAGMLGVPSGTGGTIEKFLGTLANIGETSARERWPMSLSAIARSPPTRRSTKDFVHDAIDEATSLLIEIGLEVRRRHPHPDDALLRLAVLHVSEP